MFKILITKGLIIGVFVSLFSGHFSYASQTMVIKNVQVLSFAEGRFLAPSNVAIRDGKILAIQENYNLRDAIEIDATGQFLVPGLTEMHAHIPPQEITAEDVKDLLFLYSSHGITTIRGMLGHPSHLLLRDQLAANQVKGPRLFTSGPSFNGNSVQSVEDAKTKVKKQVGSGYDFIKIHPGLSPESFDAMAKLAQQFRLPFAGHVSASVGILDSIKAGQASIDHLDGVMAELAVRSGYRGEGETGFFGAGLVEYIDPNYIAPLAKQLADSGVALVPTETLMYGFLSWQPATIAAQKDVVKLMPEDVVKSWIDSRNAMQSSAWYSTAQIQKLLSFRRDFLTAFVAAGGIVLLGSDAPQVFNVPGDSLHEEMHLMVQAGMSPIQVLYAASKGPAGYFSQQKHFGEIVPGLSADLVLLDKNPLIDITHTRSIVGVMTRGNWLDKAVIKGTLLEIKNKHRETLEQ
ncbi:amidohydrolase family protein [Thalassotalea litorea]|uniref:amidohydrolase family protein n=1 Tax=Thalassotalea litorea TaxID=2020715 RepID=UPI003736E6F6